MTKREREWYKKHPFHDCPRVTTILPLKKRHFRYRVSIRFVDASHVVFEYAFAELVRGGTRIDVYAEHCGYHSFLAVSVASVSQYEYGSGSTSPPQTGTVNGIEWDVVHAHGKAFRTTLRCVNEERGSYAETVRRKS